MENKYGKEALDYARAVCGTWGANVAMKRSAMSAEKLLSAVFGVVYAGVSFCRIEFINGDQKHELEDDAFGTVLGLVQFKAVSKLRKMRPHHNYTMTPLIQMMKPCYEEAIEKFDQERFEQQVLKGLQKDEQDRYNEIKEMPEGTEKMLVLWGWISDLFSQFRMGRETPEGFGDAEPEDYITSKEFIELVSSDEDASLNDKPIRLNRPAACAMVTGALAAENISHRVVTFKKGDAEIQYVLFTDYVDIYNIIGSRKFDLNKIDMELTEENAPLLHRKSSRKVLIVSQKASTSRKEVESGNLDDPKCGRSEDLEAEFRARERAYARVNNVGANEALILRYGSARGMQFFESLRKSQKKRLQSVVNEMPLRQVVAKMEVELKAEGACDGEDGLTEGELEVLILCRLVVWGYRVVKGIVKK